MSYKPFLNYILLINYIRLSLRSYQLVNHVDFGNAEKCYVQGHVFKGMALRNPGKHTSVWKNIIALLKMFLVSTIADAKVELTLNDKTYCCRSNEQGLFEFEIENHGLGQGWHSAELRLADELVDGQEEVKVSTEIQISTQSELIFISDIDDFV